MTTPRRAPVLDRLLAVPVRERTAPDILGHSRLEETGETAKVWAARRQLRASDTLVGEPNATIARHRAVFIVRAPTTLKHLSVFDADGLRWTVRGTAELGRMRYIELYCESNGPLAS